MENNSYFCTLFYPGPRHEHTLLNHHSKLEQPAIPEAVCGKHQEELRRTAPDNCACQRGDRRHAAVGARRRAGLHLQRTQRRRVPGLQHDADQGQDRLYLLSERRHVPAAGMGHGACRRGGHTARQPFLPVGHDDSATQQARCGHTGQLWRQHQDLRRGEAAARIHVAPAGGLARCHLAAKPDAPRHVGHGGWLQH